MWSLFPNLRPISGKDLDVKFFDKYIATCLGLATVLDLLDELISDILILKCCETFFCISSMLTFFCDERNKSFNKS